MYTGSCRVAPLVTRRATVGAMSAYRRPPIAERVFRDRDGAVIHYGKRWGGGSPPEDTYSVENDLDRFAPLHDVAEALVAHLVVTYDVAVVDDPAVGTDLLRPLENEDVVRAVRLTPPSTTAAGLTVVLTSYPSVVVHAGLLHDVPFPTCACDACDETWQNQADDLEELVLAVVAGRFGEWVTGGPRPWISHAIADESGRVVSSGGGVAGSIPTHRRRAAREVLRALGGPWEPWQRLAVGPGA